MSSSGILCKYCIHFISSKVVRKGNRRVPNSRKVECKAGGKSKIARIVSGNNLKCIRFKLNNYFPCEIYRQRVNHKACLKRIRDWTPKCNYELCTDECEQYLYELIPIHKRYDIKLPRKITRRKVVKERHKITRRKKPKHKITRRKKQ